MRFTLRLSPRNAAAYVLFALIPLAACLQQASTSDYQCYQEVPYLFSQ
jgi:hypothetical protein